VKKLPLDFHGRPPESIIFTTIGSIDSNVGSRSHGRIFVVVFGALKLSPTF